MMQIPPYSDLMPRHARRAPTEAAKYVRNEFGDKDPSWMFAGLSSDNDSNRCSCRSRTATLSESVAAEVPGPILAREGRGAEQ